VHVGPLSDDGDLNPALRTRVGWLLARLHRRLPGVRVQAWLGDLVGPGHLDLSSAATRGRVLGAVRQVLAAGFDGVHYDLEPVSSGNRGYLELLSATHALTRARHAAPPRITVLIGLPAYHTSEPGHTRAETVAAAIRGVRGLGRVPQ
jgi:hypothetical protein